MAWQALYHSKERSHFAIASETFERLHNSLFVQKKTLEFTYVSNNVPGVGVNPDDFDTPATHRCSCLGECSYENGCSCLPFGNIYNENGLLILSIASNVPITECNSNCLCYKNSTEIKCRNRVVQNGISIPLDVFKTTNKGFGLKTLSKLSKGQFVCEYAGEVIGFREAKRRCEFISSNSDSNYIFVLREHVDDEGQQETIVTCIDATSKGNLGRFLNHSCNPNTYIVPVRFDSLIPRLALFTNREVEEGEELSYSYGQSCPKSNGNFNKRCFCMSEHCSGTLPYEESLFD